MLWATPLCVAMHLSVQAGAKLWNPFSSAHSPASNTLRTTMISNKALFFITLALGAGAGMYALRGDDDLRSALGDDAPGSRWIYDDWNAAQQAAEKSGRPIFALFRCVP